MVFYTDMKRTSLTLAAAAVLAAPVAGAAQETCTVARIIDGDTFVGSGGTRVRLLLIDAPEMDQGDYGVHAQEELERLLPIGGDVQLGRTSIARTVTADCSPMSTRQPASWRMRKWSVAGSRWSPCTRRTFDTWTGSVSSKPKHEPNDEDSGRWTRSSAYPRITAAARASLPDMLARARRPRAAHEAPRQLRSACLGNVHLVSLRSWRAHPRREGFPVPLLRDSRCSTVHAESARVRQHVNLDLPAENVSSNSIQTPHRTSDASARSTAMY